MKKTLLALAVSALSVNAFAASVDYSVSPVTTPVNTIAKELVPVTSATVLTTTDATTPANSDTIKWKAGFSVTEQNLVRVDLSNGAKFATAPSLEIAGTSQGATSISAGGVGESYAIFQFVAGTVASNSDVITFKPGNLTVVNQGDINVQYRLYSTQPDAVAANASTVASGTYAYAKFANALTFSADAEKSKPSKQIDVGTGGKKFVSSGTPSSDLISAPFGGLNLSIADNTFGTNLLAANKLTLGNALAASTIEVTGDFSAFVASPATLTNAKLDGVAATALTATKATFALPAVNLAAGQLVLTTDGTKVINPSSYNAKLVLDAAAQLKTAPADVAGFANLAKNGASEDVVITMKPKSSGGFYENVVRITNKSAIEGDVSITVINDAGERATVNLGDIAGQTTSTLKAGASTTQITISDIYAAVPGLALAGQGKLRLVVDSTIPEGQLSVQSLVVSDDGSTLSRFE
ncbi:hypothetical protein [Stutzerimonas balearica]|uniref:Uncharacterized protein n=1 Tax=Stutzerimonas balearica TaxID=74829 RepID=A0A9X7YR71_9GAMM|nr:hypothetical protein [Stutzerimonas balearica]QQN49839.1 hypothetical protein I6H70_14935 [Stutzerimonas balearica]